MSDFTDPKKKIDTKVILTSMYDLNGTPIYFLVVIPYNTCIIVFFEVFICLLIIALAHFSASSLIHANE